MSSYPGITFQKLVVNETMIDSNIPSCKISFILPTHIIDAHVIADGQPIKITLKDKLKNNYKEEYNFRIFSVNNISSAQNFITVEINGIIDFYDGFMHPNEYNTCCNTYEIFKRISEDFKLESDIDTTEDKQLWCSNGKGIFDFFDLLASYGWVDDTSLMFWCITRTGKLLYKNLPNLILNNNNIKTFLQTPIEREDVYNYISSSATILSGKNNINNNGYGCKNNNHFNFNTYSYEKTIADKLKRTAKLININKQFVKGLSNERMPFDFGNFHPNYYKAYLQNKLGFSSYSTYIDLNTQFFQNCQLGEVVSIVFENDQNPDMAVGSLTGKAVVYNIQTTVDGLNSITSQVSLVMQGLNSVAKGDEDAYC
jgi:hypothetical protein